ncbi:DUF3025 domain-containing protein [Pigmentibacter sp. JX0631]|uniref:DUF3025 domain-containing protein n=1 Tax=Pigmentibacter sp. JX0631 TaxID=2976982 RepID=UPI002469212E|nr:DUF3025 domain-containing protein [Pigmentibacter sp. JX0631]WGL59835.1 DUF3025 domain-containing protein [Pigmentibacter sp. JX0631]
MVHPEITRVEKKRAENSILTTSRCWDAEFLSCSELFFPIMPYGQIFSNHSNWPTLEQLNLSKPQETKTWTGFDLKFVLQKGKRCYEGFNSLYEPRIFLQGEIRTRYENWHDFYNALIWFTFPKIKASLNMRQFFAFDENAEFPWKYPPKSRTREQDFLTIFDEGGCLLVKTDGFKIPFLFGHAVYERMTLGENDISMSCFEIDCNNDFINLSLLNKIQYLDEIGSQTLSSRNAYSNGCPFYPLKIKDALSYLKDLKNLSNYQSNA